MCTVRSVQCDRIPLVSQTETVPIRLPYEVKDKLAALAVSTNRSQSWLAAQAIASYVEEQTGPIEEIKAAIALADGPAAEWGSATAVDEWLGSWGRVAEQSGPLATTSWSVYSTCCLLT